MSDYCDINQTMDIASLITKELGIPKQYIKNYESRKDRILVAVHREWLALLLGNNEIPNFIFHETLFGDEIQTLFYEKEEQLIWHKLLVHVVVKPNDNEIVIPLPKARVVHSSADVELSYAQLLHYISETNFKNAWKHFYKKYIGDKVQNRNNDLLKGNSINRSTDIVSDIIKRFYGCKIILGNNYAAEYLSPSDKQTDFEPHPNIMPALCAVETKHCFLILHHINQIATLKDCITFSPTLINSNCTKPLFIIYQLLQVMKNSHDRGLILGNLQLDDIFISDSLFIQVIPNLQENICKMSESSESEEDSRQKPAERVEFFQNYSLKKNYGIFPLFPPDSNLQIICSKWINKEITNFDYLMYLNHVAGLIMQNRGSYSYLRITGRRFGDPSCHFIMPWVSDFATRTNGTWRDLSKSKFRLNKGDRQLDLTYESAVNSSQIPHHVSDVLSEITYYVYLSRRTPRSLLCKYVRSVWVPAEYPSSIQRLQEWTPDECIPEFFYDPTIFKSIHEDLPDLELPHWALTPEEFIEAHRECLESKHVSERLHHWIDLTFGYKLSGSAAIKSKNVCLHLVESHRKLKTSGVVQLFSYPHPPRQYQVQYFEKVPPKTLFGCSTRQPKATAMHSEKTTAGSEDEGHSSGNGEDDSYGTKSSPLLFSKLINRSKGSLLASFQISNEETSRPEQPKSTPTAQSSSSNIAIVLPKDFNPSGLLSSVEANQNFFRKTFLSQPNASSVRDNKQGKSTLKQILANKRIQEMQVLGCLVIEIFLQSKIRVVDTDDLDKRLKTCLNFLGNENLPRCVRSGLNLLLHPFRDLQNYPYITSSGLPPPSAHQLLQPLLSSFAFPFPSLFPQVYSAVCNLMSCSKAITRSYLWNSQGSHAIETLNVLKVKKLAVDLERIWEDLLSVKNDHIVGLLFPFFKELFDDPSTCRLSVILFLDKLCRNLGPIQTNELLLDTILNLYNSNIYESSENLYLYHKNFLLVLMVRCGMKVFLENFIGPLMEAVGRYKDSSDENWDDKSDSSTHDIDSDMDINNTEDDSSPDVEPNEKDPSKESETEVFAFDKDDSASYLDRDEAVRRAVEHLDLNLPSDGDQLSQDDEAFSGNYAGVKSPEINIPGVANRHGDANEASGEEKVWDFHDGFQHSSRTGHQKKVYEKFECGKDNVDFSLIKASDVAGDSIIWLAHRLGPVLTSRYLTRNLLRILSLCYTGKDNLEPYKFTEADETNLWKLSVLKWKVVGDENVETVLRVLGEISELYGEQIVLLQYLPFMSELINLSKRKFTLSLEGGIIGCLALLKFIVPYMNDATLMDQLQDVILKSIIHPVVRLASSTRFVFPSGQRGRYTLVSKLIDCLYLISLRIGAEMTKVHLAVPALQRFFLAFDKAHGVVDSNETKERENRPEQPSDRTGYLKCGDDNRYLEIQRDGTTTEWTVRGAPGEPISIAHVRSHESLDSSPCDQQDKNKIQNKALAELKSVFDAQLAHQCYGSFFRFLGETAMENALKNQNLIRDLYCRHEQEQAVYSRAGFANQNVSSSGTTEKGCVGSFGSNVAVIGNKIEVQMVDFGDSLAVGNAPMDSDVLALICRKKEDYGRHIRGNWLAYWEHEIGRSEKDTKFNFKQIKLQSFTGHSNSVRMIQCLDNENSFISGSKDKTVKLWSLRSQGDGNSTKGCQFTYAHHRKSLLSLSFIHSVRLVASCDSIIHLWDPFEGKTISVMDNAKVAPINVLKALNPPSCNLIAATTEATLKIIDTRLCSFVSEYKISMNSVGLIRSICVSPNGNWIAVGQASGLLTVLDVRTGMVLSSWKGHESEVLQLAAVRDNVLISSSLDQTVSAWNVSDGKFKFHIKGPAEPVHCLAVYNSELITGTTANRIGVHTSIDSQASFSSTKLRSDAFKGILTSMTVLPLNRLLLLGADNGNITLLC